MSAFFLLAIVVYVVSAAIAGYRHHRRVHGGQLKIECIGCRNRRRLLRVALIAFTALAILLYEGDVHLPDFGFLLLAIVVELT